MCVPGRLICSLVLTPMLVSLTDLLYLCLIQVPGILRVKAIERQGSAGEAS